jgi:hypothetical protein
MADTAPTPSLTGSFTTPTASGCAGTPCAAVIPRTPQMAQKRQLSRRRPGSKPLYGPLTRADDIYVVGS